MMVVCKTTRNSALVRPCSSDAQYSCWKMYAFSTFMHVTPHHFLFCLLYAFYLFAVVPAGLNHMCRGVVLDCQNKETTFAGQS
jgi:hypothetical protein